MASTDTQFERVYISETDDGFFVIPYELKDEFKRLDAKLFELEEEDSECDEFYDTLDEFNEKFDRYGIGSDLNGIGLYIKTI